MKEMLENAVRVNAQWDKKKKAVRFEISYKIRDWKQEVNLRNRIPVTGRKGVLVTLSDSRWFGQETYFGPSDVDYDDVFLGISLGLEQEGKLIPSKLSVSALPFNKNSRAAPNPKIEPKTGAAAEKHWLSGSVGGVFEPCFLFYLYPA